MPKAKAKTKGAPDPSVAGPSAVGATLDDAAPAGSPPAGSPPAGPPPASPPPAGAPPAPATGRDIIPDSETYLFIKQTSRESYKNAWEAFRASCTAQEEFEVRTPNEKELLEYFVKLREGSVLEDGQRVEGKAGSTILTTYSLLNGVMKHKYSFNMREFPRIGARMKVWLSEDVKKKAAVFTPEELKQFCESEELQGGYWEVRKAIAILAYFGGLRLTEAMGLLLEKISPCPEGFNVVHDRAKGRTDKPSSKFTVPKKKEPKQDEDEEDVDEDKKIEDSFDWAAVLGQYIGRVREELGKYQGRVFYTGRKNGGLQSQPMGRNMLCEVPHQIARFLGKPNPEDFTFHSFRRSSATAAADAGATAQQMQDFFGWKHPSMTAEYISTSRHQLNNMARKLGNVQEEGSKAKGKKKKKQKKKRKRDRSSSSSSSTSTSEEEEEERRRKVVKKGKKGKKVIIINM